MAVLSLNTNLASLQTQRRLGESTAALTKSQERLSSGLRISRASDDAAGLAIASGLNVDSRIFSQGLRNLADGVSITNIAEGTLNELTNIVTRIQELAEQAANGTLGNKQRAALDAEAQALSREYFRISRTTEFNGQKLFDGSMQGLVIQSGVGTSSGLGLSLGGVMGDGTFRTNVNYSTVPGASNRMMGVGDLNGDGIVDMVAASNTQSEVGVLLGNGDGSFQAGSVVPALTASAVQLGDVNNDGFLDIVAASTGVHRVAVLLGNGDATFGASRSFSTNGTWANSSPMELALGDLNGDSRLDIVTADEGGPGGFSVLLNAGDGTFGSADRSSDFQPFTSVALADMNGDQITDIVGGSLGSGVATVLGNGDGTFQAIRNYSTSGAGPTIARLGDLNGDGILDVACGNPGGMAISVLLGNGDGSLRAQPNINVGGGVGMQAGPVGIGDFNGDGISDLVVDGFLPAGFGVRILIGNGDATFKSQVVYGSGAGTTAGLGLADFNRDGALDIAAAITGAIGVLLANTREGTAPLLDFSLETKADAKWALELMKQKLTQLAQQRGSIGAGQSRISTALAALRVEAENYAAASSRILDVDVAEESSQLLKTQILEQAASAVLGQANAAPALALNLLKG